MRNGRMGGFDAGGKAGDSGDVMGCAFPPQAGEAWRGGAGGQYGGGGGSGCVSSSPFELLAEFDQNK